MGDLVDEAERVRLAHARPAQEMKPTTRLEKIEIGRLLEMSSIDDAAPAAISDDASVPTVVASLDHLPIRTRVDAVGSDVRGRDPVVKTRPRIGERVAMRAIERRASARWFELAVALVASAWIAARLLGL